MGAIGLAEANCDRILMRHGRQKTTTSTSYRVVRFTVHFGGDRGDIAIGILTRLMVYIAIWNPSLLPGRGNELPVFLTGVLLWRAMSMVVEYYYKGTELLPGYMIIL